MMKGFKQLIKKKSLHTGSQKKNSKEIKKDGANRILDQYEQLQNVKINLKYNIQNMINFDAIGKKLEEIPKCTTHLRQTFLIAHTKF